MIEVIEKYFDLTADFINKLFLFQVEFETGKFFPIGKIVLAFLFVVLTIYLIFDAMGFLEKGDEN